MSTRSVRSWISDALERQTVVRSLKVAAVVGSLLALINYGDRLLAGGMAGRDWLKLALTYGVPYGVSTFASVGATRATRQRVRPGGGGT
jgi:hypothetical protein